jgi:hypothetical protein
MNNCLEIRIHNPGSDAAAMERNFYRDETTEERHLK